MSSLLFKNDIHNILPHTTTENNSNILNNIKINNLNEDNSISATSSAFMNNINLNTATSSVNLSQMNGGNYINSATSDLKSDINNLVSMLTSESNNNNKNISTPSLENKLRKMLNQDGGNFSDEMNTEELENRIYEIVKNNKQQGGFDTSNVVKIGLAATGAYLAYNLLKPTETETEVNIQKLLNMSQVPVQQPAPIQKQPAPIQQQVPFQQQVPIQQPAPIQQQVPIQQQYNTASPKFATPQVELPGIKDIKSLPKISATSPMMSATSPMMSATSPMMSANSQMMSATSPIMSATSPIMSATSPMMSETSASENIFLKPQTLNKQQPMITTTDVSLSPTSSYMPMDSRLKQLNQVQQGGNPNDLVGGNNPALIAFRTIVKNVVSKLDIKYNKALKVAAKIQADVKSADPKISHEKLADAADKQLEKNMKEYKDFAKTL
jgi:hypothetical protein